jgi:hypothetical protein
MFGISPPLSIDDLFVNWSKMGGNLHNSLLLTAVSAFKLLNKVVFDKCRPKTFLQEGNSLATTMGKIAAA